MAHVCSLARKWNGDTKIKDRKNLNVFAGLSVKMYSKVPSTCTQAFPKSFFYVFWLIANTFSEFLGCWQCTWRSRDLKKKNPICKNTPDHVDYWMCLCLALWYLQKLVYPANIGTFKSDLSWMGLFPCRVLLHVHKAKLETVVIAHTDPISVSVSCYLIRQRT